MQEWFYSDNASAKFYKAKVRMFLDCKYILNLTQIILTLCAILKRAFSLERHVRVGHFCKLVKTKYFFSLRHACNPSIRTYFSEAENVFWLTAARWRRMWEQQENLFMPLGGIFLW